MKNQLKQLVAERRVIKARLTGFKRFIESTPCDMDIDALENKVKSYEDFHTKFDSVQCKIEMLVTCSECETMHLDEREDLENVFFSLIARAESLVTDLRGPRESIVSPNTMFSGCTESRGALRLPTITLPNFDGTYEHWVRFRDTFLTIVHNNESLSDIQRFHYLTSALKGTAARTIESMGVFGANYKLAWASLKRRFEDPDSLIHHHVNNILEIPRIATQTSQSLREFVDKANNQLIALGALGEPIESWDTFMIILLAKKLDSKTIETWDMNATTATHRPKFNDFVQFLEQLAKLLERAATNPQVMDQTRQARAHRSLGKSERVAVNVSSTRIQCVLYKGEHHLQQCGKLKALPMIERHKTIKRLQSCFNHLKQGHSVKNCTRRTCRKYGRTHHTVLHREEPSQNTVAADSSSIVVSSCLANSASTPVEYTVLSTAIVRIKDRHGNEHECRALQDAGSQAHFITEELCDQLGCPRLPVSTVVGGFGRTPNTIKIKSSLTINSIDRNFRATLTCLVVKHITDDLPHIPTESLKICVPTNISPADSQFNKRSRIALLIGIGLFWKLLCIGLQRVNSTNLIWQKTRLGWVVGGSMHTLANSYANNTSLSHSVTTTDLCKTISQFWEIEDHQHKSTNISGSSTDSSETYDDVTGPRRSQTLTTNKSARERESGREKERGRGIEAKIIQCHDYSDHVTHL